MYEKCCSNSNLIGYTLEHKPKPLDMIPELRESIDRLLWYVPGINSYQSEESYVIDDILYSYPFFEDVLLAAGVDLEKDLKLIDDAYIQDTDVDYYKNKICINCQKVILTRSKNYLKSGKSETWLRALLRHVRNAIAHGRFTTIGSLVLFMDQNPNNKDTALLKLDAIKFNQALKVIEEFGGVKRSSTRGVTEERIISSVFRKNGYTVTNQFGVGNIRADFIAMKDGKQYAIEIKLGDYKSVGYQDKLIKNIESLLKVYLVEGYIPVLIYDRGWLTQKAKDYLEDKQFIVFDKIDLSDFFDGKLDLKSI